MGNEVQKGRVGDYLVVPDSYQIGEEIDINVETNKTLSDSSDSSSDFHTKDIMTHPKAAVMNINEATATLNTFFHWQCHQCTSTNFFLNDICINCNHMRGNSLPSALLDIVENASKDVCTVEEALEKVNVHQRDCIPENVLLACLERTKTSHQSNIDPSTKVDIANFFYWNCGFCTMKNSYKVYTCKCCGQEVSFQKVSI